MSEVLCVGNSSRSNIGNSVRCEGDGFFFVILVFLFLLVNVQSVRGTFCVGNSSRSEGECTGLVLVQCSSLLY